mmetsp:Transcript_19736/g.43920  ORF Transcript_19736/g.43920 Transcript_19736/m.43920 type:complete len:209 (-) Transcript_19736:52-678(-)|eukprot:CAMPEP_0204322154 /NCGR_PEP_ID=MMETSP0469-20131031/8537_1 /ASSEMBLY_ACC=CAM_ASM_000384 /TAXON_ID=2969 /ORGANISM="Oxyrrhis marina" /LENGTH=208 /DNA_ID=CAMNT_0051303487 /DNA_START=57 /DNA_END=683 /DNA_ORIENTATION=+
MSKPELIYFDGPGRGELARLAFSAGGVEFTDTRHAMADWPKILADPEALPHQFFGQMPIILHGDVKLAQSVALSNYAADIGINTKSNPTAAQRGLDNMMLGAHSDLQAAMYKVLFGSDDSKAAGKEALPAAAAKTLKGIEGAYGEGPFLYRTDGPSLGDLAVFDAVTSPFPGLKACGIDLEAYPKINKAVAAVADDANVKAYCQKRGF